IIDIPIVIISFNSSFPVFVFDVVYGMWGNNQQIILPILCPVISWIGGGQLHIGNEIKAVWQVYLQVIQQTLFSGIYNRIEIWWYYDFCHDSISFSTNSIALSSPFRAESK